MNVVWRFWFSFMVVQLPWLLCSPSYANGHAATESGGAIQQNDKMFQVGEELEYSVHYSFFNIGTIHFKVIDREEQNGRTVYHTSAFMDSDPSLSWLVDLHVRFYSEIDQDVFTHSWLSEDSTSTRINYRKMFFDYERHKMYYEGGERLHSGERKSIVKDTITISNNCQDGLSLFFYARAHVREKRKAEIPTYMDTAQVITNINLGVEYPEEEIDAIKYPISGVKLDGKANFVGIFGLTGEFSGVFSNDDASIPLLARMKVILGSIRVELRKWNRSTWVPPRSGK